MFSNGHHNFLNISISWASINISNLYALLEKAALQLFMKLSAIKMEKDMQQKHFQKML